MNKDQKQTIVEQMNDDARRIAETISAWGCLGDKVLEIANALIAAEGQIGILASPVPESELRNKTALEVAREYNIIPEKLQGGPLASIFK